MSRAKAQTWFLFRVCVATALLLALKSAAHFLGWEVITVNTLFSGIVAANVFLMGFLLSGVLADYKEAEKLPAEVAACLENLGQEIRGSGVGKPEVGVGPALTAVSNLSVSIIEWFHRRLDTQGLVALIDDLTVKFAELEPRTQVGYIARFRQEQSNLRRTIMRIDTIRGTEFVAAGYLLVNTITLLLCAGLILAGLEPFYESLFTTGVIAFLLIFLLTLIRDLDNPFGYDDRFSGTDVSLWPIKKSIARLAALAGVRKGQRYRTREELEVLYVTHWKTAFKGGGKGRIPAGTMLTVVEDPAEGSASAACIADNSAELETTLVPEHERTDDKYDGFSLTIDIETLRDRCELAV
jgi:hypothetical protein